MEEKSFNSKQLSILEEINHQLRTPLTKILSSADLLAITECGCDDEKSRKRIRYIQEGVQEILDNFQGENLLKKLITFAQAYEED